ncbi:MAG: MBL fold metallo-hydrolase [Pirellulaceae bacterium]|nr:MBL fold metallo-hydrolase [Pirellulaceae bacterium]
MLTIPLQSGSSGNCVYVEAGGVRLLIDAGISGVSAQRRLAAAGRNITEVDAVLVSHDHADHASCLGVYHRKFGLPIHVTQKTLTAAGSRRPLGKIDSPCFFRAGETLHFGSVAIETVATPHDGADGVVFVIDDGRSRLGVLTDLGHVFAELPAVIQSLDAVVLESNYDPDLLDDGDYPAFLKARIAGPNGHLSNFEAAELLACANGRLRWACLAHLSRDNNRPQLALKTHREILGRRLELHVASRDEAIDALEV